MNTFPSQRAFNQALFDRLRMLRKEIRITQEKMAEALDIPLSRYRKYEKRNAIPNYLIPRFAARVGRSVEFVLTGHE